MRISMFFIKSRRTIFLLLLFAARLNSFCRNHFSARTRISALNLKDDNLPSKDGNLIQSQIAAYNAMAAKLRAEAAELEAVQQQERANAIAAAFDDFDTNRDGSISVEELRDGLSKLLKETVTNQQAEELIKIFDSSGDGAIQLNEFTGVDGLRNKFEQFVRDEKMAALTAEMVARETKLQAEEARAYLKIVEEYLNAKPPSAVDRIVSTIPYILPLIDALQYGRPLLEPFEANPLVKIWIILYTLYAKIPFSGLVAFYAITLLSKNMSLNRLVRFNLLQAIYIDISILFPTVFAGFVDFLPPSISSIILPISSIATFLTLAGMVGYSIGSSLLGVVPDRIPLLSDQVKSRVPSIDMIDTEGLLRGPDNDSDMKNKE